MTRSRTVVLYGFLLRRLTRPPIANLGLKGLKKWADLVVHPKDPKGWPKVFHPGLPLYATLLYVFVSIEISGTGGAGFRRMYADFLDELSGPFGESSFAPAAALYREAAEQWSLLAKAALPDAVSAFAETRALLVRKNELFEQSGADALDEMRRINDHLESIRKDITRRFPLEGAGVRALLEYLRERILAVHEKEVAAAECALSALRRSE